MVHGVAYMAFAVVVLTVPKEDRRRFLMMAHELGMTKGDYVFYTMEMLPEEDVLDPEDVWASADGQNAIAKQAFEAVFHVRRSSHTSLYLIVCTDVYATDSIPFS